MKLKTARLHLSYNPEVKRFRCPGGPKLQKKELQRGTSHHQLYRRAALCPMPEPLGGPWFAGASRLLEEQRP